MWQLNLLVNGVTEAIHTYLLQRCNYLLGYLTIAVNAIMQVTLVNAIELMRLLTMLLRGLADVYVAYKIVKWNHLPLVSR